MVSRKTTSSTCVLSVELSEQTLLARVSQTEDGISVSVPSIHTFQTDDLLKVAELIKEVHAEKCKMESLRD